MGGGTVSTAYARGMGAQGTAIVRSHLRSAVMAPTPPSSPVSFCGVASRGPVPNESLEINCERCWARMAAKSEALLEAPRVRDRARRLPWNKQAPTPRAYGESTRLEKHTQRTSWRTHEASARHYRPNPTLDRTSPRQRCRRRTARVLQCRPAYPSTALELECVALNGSKGLRLAQWLPTPCPVALSTPRPMAQIPRLFQHAPHKQSKRGRHNRYQQFPQRPTGICLVCDCEPEQQLSGRCAGGWNAGW